MSNIEWTQKTWNPITGCTKVSAGCAYCYAEGIAKRFWGDREFGDVRFHEERLEIPFKRKKPTTYFVNSMSDLFHESVKDEWIDEIMAAIALTPQHTYQVLTKRPQRMLEYFQKANERTAKMELAAAIARSISETENVQFFYPKTIGKLIKEESIFPLKNLWLGVTVENQQVADERIPLLLEMPAAIRFLSVEPMLEKINFSYCGNIDYSINALTGEETYDHSHRRGIYSGVNWIIIGGESGPKARPFHLEWAIASIEQCKKAKVPVFFKQAGSNPWYKGKPLKLKSSKGSDLSELPQMLNVREFPNKP